MAKVIRNKKNVSLSANATEFNTELDALQPGEQMTYQNEDGSPLVTAVVEQSAPNLLAQQQPEGTSLARPMVDLVTLSLPADSKETAQYIITPTMGKAPRWFEKKRLASWTKNEDGTFSIQLPRRAVKDRGLGDLVADQKAEEAVAA